MKNLLAEQGYQYHPHHHTIDDIPEDTRIVVSLRNPIDRFASLYSLYQKSGHERDTPPPVDDLAADVRGVFSKEDWRRWGYMFRPQVWWVHDAEEMKARNVIWLRTERLNQDVTEKLGLDLDIEQGPLKHIDISDRNRRFLETYYEEDFLLLEELER